MKIHIFSITRNEEQILPYFLRHYETFADKIFILDDHSTDKTVEIAKAHPKVQLLEFPYEGGLNEGEHSACFTESYKQYSRGVADWVMCVDADEFIYHRDIKAVLKRQLKKGTKVIKATGYNMFSRFYPTTSGQIYEECNRGIRNSLYDKRVIFDPQIDITWGAGRHMALLPEGVDFLRCKLLLLHFRYLDRESTRKRLETPRHGATDRKMDWKRQVNLGRYEQGIRGELGKMKKLL